MQNIMVQKQCGLSWCKAYNVLVNGGIVAREGWNGKGLFVIMRPKMEIEISLTPTASNIIKSVGISDSALALALTTCNNAAKEINEETEGGSIPYILHYQLDSHFLIKTTQGIFNIWVPSISDLQADDWCVLEVELQRHRDNKPERGQIISDYVNLTDTLSPQ